MRSQRFKIAVVCLIATVSFSILWGADLNIMGNVNVQGDGSNSAPGDLKVKGKLTTFGTLTSNGALKAIKFYKTYHAVAPVKNIHLGDWDFCFLTMTQFEGLGDQCLVESSLSGGSNFQATWQLSAGGRALCAATCLSFSPDLTGE